MSSLTPLRWRVLALAIVSARDRSVHSIVFCKVPGYTLPYRVLIVFSLCTERLGLAMPSGLWAEQSDSQSVVSYYTRSLVSSQYAVQTDVGPPLRRDFDSWCSDRTARKLVRDTAKIIRIESGYCCKVPSPCARTLIMCCFTLVQSMSSNKIQINVLRKELHIRSSSRAEVREDGRNMVCAILEGA